MTPAWPRGHRLLELDRVDSTNLEARRRAQVGEAGPLWIMAARQSAGRGRRGNVWQASEGNLMTTLLLTPARDPADWPQIGFVAALAVSDMVAGYAPSASVRVKWPNDVLLDGGKVAGILVEGAQGWLAAGIGVNLAAHPADTPYRAASLAGLGFAPPAPKDALLMLADRFACWLERWTQSGFAPLRDAWLARAEALGGEMRARLPQGDVCGRFGGIDERGALILSLTGGGERRIAAGEIFPV